MAREPQASATLIAPSAEEVAGLLVVNVELEEVSPLAEEASWLGSPGPDGAGQDLLDIRMPPTTWHLTGTSRLDAEHLGELSLLYRQSQIGGLGSYHFTFGWKKAHPTLASGQ